MELLYLGTGAAEGYPALFCRCEHCVQARRLGGRDLRRRTSALIDGELLIDVGPDLLAAAHTNALDLNAVRWVLQTHQHSDHLLESNFTFRGPGFAGTPPEPWELCGSGKTVETIRGYGDLPAIRVTPRSVSAFESFQLGPYAVTALLARHDMAIDPLFYAIRREGKALLWGNDTGPFFEETWQALQQLGEQGVRFDVACIEATMGIRPMPNDAPPWGHMNLEQCGQHHRQLAERGLLVEGARLFAQHFSHISTPLHAEVEQILQPYGVAPAYDGLTVRW